MTRKLSIIVAAGVFAFASAGVSIAQQADEKTSDGLLFLGTVTGNDVYVRSGPSGNYYPVIKLSAGTVVRVTGEQEGWFAIVPPKECFSLMHKNFIDRDTDGDGGVVNANAVLVRAGSAISPNQLYAKQAKLSRRARVQVLGPHDDDWLRIVPPDDARLYISAEYVSSGAAKPTTKRETPSTTVPPALTSDAAEPEETRTADDVAPSAIEKRDFGDGEYRDVLAELDAALKAEWKRPLLHRNYSALIGRYRAVAEQEGDEFARDYAAARISQLDQAMEAAAAVREMRALADEVTTLRVEEDRNRILNRSAESIGPGFDIVGVLRTSMIWDGRTAPLRYRLVSADSVAMRTIGYVEIPRDSSIDPAMFLGRRVGVRALARRVETGDVDPVVVYVAAELVVVDTPAPTTADAVPVPKPLGSR